MKTIKLTSGVNVHWHNGKMAVDMPTTENKTTTFKNLMKLWE